MQKMHPERFAHAAHFRVQKIHPESCVSVERARWRVAFAPALHGRSTNMRVSKSSHPQCPPRLHRPPHTQNTGIHLAFPWVSALLLNPTTNTPRRCGSSGHPTRVFAALTRLPPCHSKAQPTRLLQRVLCVHPSAPITPSPFVQCAQLPDQMHPGFPCNQLAWRFGGRAIPLQLQRVLSLSPTRAGRLPSALLRTTCALSAHNRSSRSFPLSPSSPPWRAGRRAFGQPALARRQLPHCRNRRNGAAQKSPVCWRVQQTSLLGNSCSFD
jgi:hypothetical protein